MIDSLKTVAKQESIIINKDKYMTAPGLVASAINETNEMSSSKSLVMTLALTTPTGARNLSPVIDTKRLSAHLIQNRLNNPVSGTNWVTQTGFYKITLMPDAEVESETITTTFNDISPEIEDKALNPTEITAEMSKKIEDKINKQKDEC